LIENVLYESRFYFSIFDSRKNKTLLFDSIRKEEEEKNHGDFIGFISIVNYSIF
jgi:hypothetical protein